jgi:MOSC domain-containing protein YiiM
MEVNPPGQVVAVCMSPNGGVPKYSQESIAIGIQGIEGDYHSGPINRHKKTGPAEPNSRQVTLVAQEVLEEMNARLGTGLKSGDLGENILISGLGDLSLLLRGDRLQLGTDVVLEIKAQNNPCNVIRVYHPTLVEEINGKRGVSAIVLNPGSVKPGDVCLALNRSE